jgi:adenylate cyclase
MPTAVLAQSSMIGFVNADPSSVDNIRRKLPVIVRVGTNVYPSLVLQMLMRNELLGPDAIEIVLGEHIKVNGEKESWTIPIDEHGLMEINYRGGNSLENDAFGGVNSISYFGLASHLAQTAGKLKLQSMVPISDEDWPSGYPNPDDPSKEIAIPPVKDQFLIIGQNAAGLTDFGPTPMGSQTPLVKVHATALNNILQSDYISRPSTALWIFIWLSIGWASVVLLRETAVWLSISVPVVMAAAYVGGAFWFFSSQSLHIPIVWPVLGIFVAHGASITRRLIVESKAKGQIKAMFSTYVAPDVVNSLIEAGVAPKLGGEETEITAFFSDIQAFSSFSEKLTPERLVALMNEYLSDMSSILKNKGTGTLDKFIGDAIVGIFGAPLHYADHAYKGCRTAIDIQRRQAELREKWKSEPDWPEIVHGMQTRIGLNSGPAVVGNMGAVDQMNYTMMGDTVNLAARCESGAKSYGVFNMISGETKDAAIKHGKDDIAYRYLDRIVVKGRTQPVEMYEIVEFKKDLIPSASECLELFENGIKKYLAQDWDGAKALFEKSEPLEIYRPGMPGVGSNASLVLIDRCVAMKASPPAADWDGVFVMTTK